LPYNDGVHLSGDLIKRKTLLPEPSNDKPYGWQIPIHGRAPFVNIMNMSTAEQMFFLGSALAHVVAYEERRRLQRIDRQMARSG
jgi:hypothetical protein